LWFNIDNPVICIHDGGLEAMVTILKGAMYIAVVSITFTGKPNTTAKYTLAVIGIHFEFVGIKHRFV
jgi:hypothetical protein